MHAFDLAAVLLAAAAVTGYLNRRVLGLPAMSGTLVVALASSVLVVIADRLVPDWRLGPTMVGLLADVDFNRTVLRGMLGFLLFAGALHLDLEGLIDDKWLIGSLATAGVVVSTAVIGSLAFWAFQAVGSAVPWSSCFVFGALISPTDPIAVLALVKTLNVPARITALIAGESLFNDGVGVVVFFALLALGSEGRPDPTIGGVIGELLRFAMREVGGGALLGLTTGYLAYRALRTIDDHPLELLITLALVTGTYALGFAVHVSGPIAVVVAGIVMGRFGRRAMSEHTRAHVEAFWAMLDEVLNVMLFLLIGWQILAIATGTAALLGALAAVPIALIGRALAVSLSVGALRLAGQDIRGLFPILTWSGLRGGLSIAMALSMPARDGRAAILTATYAVVVFSILVQGLTMRRVLARYAGQSI